MSSQNAFLSGAIAAYMEANSTSPDEVQLDLRTTTAELGELSIMQINPVQGTLMTLLVSVLQPRFAVEVGTFTGYSALCVAKALPPGGRLLCCDISEEWTAVAREHWERANVADRIDLRIAPALETLRALPPEPKIDFAFIDADKAQYVDYYEEVVSRLSERGVILVDNTLRDGTVADASNTDAGAEEMRAFNTHVVNDERVTVSLLPVGDGLSVIALRTG